MRSINSPNSPILSGGYSQALEVTNSKRTLYISGQIPMDSNGVIPKTFQEQAKLTWKNIENQLHEADMTLDNIVKHTTFLSSREYCQPNSEVRQQILGQRKPALTVVIAEIYDEAWFLEIEAIAVA